ncbi:MAG: hypothetical protein ACU0DW_09200 [Shimia sp.]
MSSRWAKRLDQDETLLWEGKPDTRFHLTPIVMLEVAAGVLLIIGAIAYGINLGERLDQFGQIVLTIATITGLFMVGHGLLSDVISRRGQWYALTDRAAMIERDPLVGQSAVETYAIDQDMPISLENTRPPTLWFADKLVDTESGQMVEKIGFERIAEAQDVLALLREAQQKALDRPNARSPVSDID